MNLVAILAFAGACFYAGYQRGRRVETETDWAARRALVDIAERLADQTLSGLGREIRNIAMKGLKGC